MDWQQKAGALNALDPLSIKCRGPQDWYVAQRVEIKDRGVLVGSYGNGETPQAAIDDHWQQLVTDIVGTRKYLVINAAGRDRKAFRWNGYMWADVDEGIAPSPYTANGENDV